MSAKKQKGLTGWIDCSKCEKKISRNSVTKHSGEDDVCRPVYPYLKKNELFCLLNNVTTVTKKIGDLPFIKDKRIASSTVFLSEELIKECGFISFGWVAVNPITAQCSKQGDNYNEDNQSVCLEEETASSSYAFRVWPIPESIGSNQSNLQVVLSMEGFSVNKFIPSNIKSELGDVPIGLATIKPLNFSLKSAQEIFQNAQEIVLVVTNFNEVDQGSFEVNRFVKSFQRVFQGRPVAVNNRFKLRFYSQFVHFYVKSIALDNQSEETLGLERLSIDQPTIKAFAVIGKSTNVQVISDESFETVISEESSRKIFFDDIGGLTNVISEVKSTVNFILNTDLDVPNGILLYGNSGVGKTMMVQAIANEFKIFKICYEEFPRFNSAQGETGSTSLEKVFKDAVSRSPSVIVVEGLDVIAPRKKSESGAAPLTPFTAQFLRLASSNQVKKSKTLIICTTSDLDRIDPNIRSPKLFAKEIEVPIPSAPDRDDIFRKILRNIRHNLSDEDIKFVSDNTHGFVAADLKSLCNQAVLHVATKTVSGNWYGSDNPITIANIEECLKLVKPSAIKSILIDVPNVKWSDIGGQDDLKFKLKQAIEWPLKHPESFKRLGISSPKGILMYGPPGCSKTMIAKAIATESRLNFISVKGSELFSKWVGESEKAVQAIFRKARQVAPCVIFFDEIDSLGGERGTSSGSSNVHERVLAQILVEMDGIEALKDVTIVAATNRPDRIDQALLRPGRLDRIIYVPLPDENTRREILKIRFNKMLVSPDVNIEEVVKRTNGYSGAELTAVCHEAALKALEEDITCDSINQQHFNAALDSVKPRITKDQIDFYENYSRSRKQL